MKTCIKRGDIQRLRSTQGFPESRAEAAGGSRAGSAEAGPLAVGRLGARNSRPLRD